jgi:flavodoxin
MKFLILYDSLFGNTKKVAERIYKTIEVTGHHATLLKISADLNAQPKVLNLDDYDVVFCGSPVIDWLPTNAMMNFLKVLLKEYRGKGHVMPSTPIKPGKYAVCFGTYCGAHIGANEAIPMIYWLESFFGHIGFVVLDKLLVPGEFRKKEMGAEIVELNNTIGRLGNIFGRPNEHDLNEVEIFTKGILSTLL